MLQRPEEIAFLPAIRLDGDHRRRERAAGLRRRDSITQFAAPRLVVDELREGRVPGVLEKVSQRAAHSGSTHICVEIKFRAPHAIDAIFSP